MEKYINDRDCAHKVWRMSSDNLVLKNDKFNLSNQILLRDATRSLSPLTMPLDNFE